MYEENIVVNLLVCQSGFWNLSSMDEEATSWIRRTKFSHTVCHRMDPSLLSSSLPLRANRVSWTKIGREATLAYQRSVSNVVEVHNNPTNNKVRTVSPLPELRLPETFSEARSNQKRFSTPSPRRRDSEKSALTKFFNRDTKVTKSFSETKSSTSEVKFQRNARSLPHSTSLKPNDKSKTQKESSGWSKYFDHNGGRVSSVETLDEQFEVDLSKLFLGLRFAHGAHSQLYRGKYKEEPVAVKIIRFPDDDENGSLCSRFEKQFTREVTLLSRLRHQNVLRFVAACQKPPVLCIITEYLPLGSLRSYLHKLEEKPLPLQKLLSMALEIARGMEYIHSMGVIHRDLKPENILITEDFHLKVADFGIACEENSCDVISDDPGTYRWMAPEMIDRKHYKNYGRKVDVYGFGLILWEFVAGTIPYEDMTPIQAAYAVVTKKLRPVVPPHCPPVMKILIEQCWSSRPERRPEFQQIVKVLEELESRFSRDGSLDLVPKSILQDILKGQFHYNQKLGASNKTPPRANPKFL